MYVLSFLPFKLKLFSKKTFAVGELRIYTYILSIPIKEEKVWVAKFDQFSADA